MPTDTVYIICPAFYFRSTWLLVPLKFYLRSINARITIRVRMDQHSAQWLGPLTQVWKVWESWIQIYLWPFFFVFNLKFISSSVLIAMVKTQSGIWDLKRLIYSNQALKNLNEIAVAHLLQLSKWSIRLNYQSYLHIIPKNFPIPPRPCINKARNHCGGSFIWG